MTTELDHESVLQQRISRERSQEEIRAKSQDMLDMLKDFRHESRELLVYCLDQENAKHLLSFRQGVETAAKLFDNLLMDYELKNLVKYN